MRQIACQRGERVYHRVAPIAPRGRAMMGRRSQPGEDSRIDLEEPVTEQRPPHPVPDPDDASDLRLSRRTLLRGAAGAMLALPPLLAAACGGSGSSSGAGTTVASTGDGAVTETGAATTGEGGPTVTGGTVRNGIVSAGAAETLDPSIGVTPIDQARAQNLYDPLVIVNPDLTTAPGLALEWNPNTDATEYEVKLRPDVTFHN